MDTRGDGFIIGKETFSSIDWFFSLAGTISPNFIKRIHRIGETGIWQWWVDMFDRKHLAIENADNVKAGNLEGNIVIVFVVWGSGVGLGVLCGILEFLCDALLRKIAPCSILVYLRRCFHRMLVHSM